MSYILDALKRAETEKDGQGFPITPGLSGMDVAPRPPRHQIWRFVTAGAVAVLMLGLGGIYFLGHKSPLTPPLRQAQDRLFQRGEQEVVSNSKAGSALVPSLEKERQSVVPPFAKNPPLPPSEKGGDKNEGLEPAPENLLIPGGISNVPQVPPASQSKPSQPVDEEPLKESSILQLIEMPESFQQSIPPLQFKGHFYSTDPNKGSVVVGEKVFPVGSEIAPGVTLEAVTPTGVILNAQNTRFRIEVLGNWVY